MVRDHRFWVGVVAGVVLVYAWHKYQMRKQGQ